LVLLLHKNTTTNYRRTAGAHSNRPR